MPMDNDQGRMALQRRFDSWRTTAAPLPCVSMVYWHVRMDGRGEPGYEETIAEAME